MDLTKLIKDSFKQDEFACKDLFDFVNNTLNPIQNINEDVLFFYKRLHTIAAYYQYMVSTVHNFEYFSRIKQFKLVENHSIPDMVFCSNAISFYIFAYTLIETLNFTIDHNYPKDKILIKKILSKYKSLTNEIKNIRDRFVHAEEDKTKKESRYNWTIGKRNGINLGDPDGGEERSFVSISQSSFKDNKHVEFKLMPRKHFNEINNFLSEIGKIFEIDFQDIKEQNKERYKMF